MRPHALRLRKKATRVLLACLPACYDTAYEQVGRKQV